MSASPFRCGSVIGTISSRNQPASVAAAARRWLSAAQASCSARDTWYSSATTSPDRPMWQFSNAHHRPSWIIRSWISPLPMRRPSRRRGSAYGVLLMDSMPPATTTSASPSRTACAASITALSPEPHTLLIVSAPTVVGQPGLERGLARGRLTQAGRHDVAQDALVDLRRVQPGARDGFADGDRAQLGSGERLEHAQELAGGRARCAQDDGV